MKRFLKPRFRFYKQLNTMDCGIACLRMIAGFYGKHYSMDSLRKLSGFNKGGVTLLGISDASAKIGLYAEGLQVTYEELVSEVELPCILHWDHSHFVVLLSVGRKRIKIADPARGVLQYTPEEFMQHWTDDKEGIVLLLIPDETITPPQQEKERRFNWKEIFRYVIENRLEFAKVLTALLITSLLQIIFPFLTQNIVDVGINTRDLQYVTVILIAQLMLIFSRTIIDFIRSRVLLTISIIVNLSVLSDFVIKLSKLPLSYFDTRHTGDTLQRINDNKQVQSFITGPALSTFFSLFNFIIYGVILAMYKLSLFAVFVIGSGLYLLWIFFFFKVRRKINYDTFHMSAKENDATLEIVQGMQEIRLNNAEQLKRWQWERIQVDLSKLSIKSMNYSQLQQIGAVFINQGKDVIITFMVARLVIYGQLTLGSMLAIQYIIGQLSGPVEQFLVLMQNGQDTRISMERLNEVHELEDEENRHEKYTSSMPEDKSIRIEKLSFAYPGTGDKKVLDNINLEIPEGKVTAIVGHSGSGKTTLLKLLLKFYIVYEGEINLGKQSFASLQPSFWRKQCGAVLQDGYIFNDNIARNIAVADEIPDKQKLMKVCKTTNILSFIASLPNSFQTKLGTEGIGISQGQKQRLLIARALYNDPQYLFLDEATNALDAENERIIVNNLQYIFSNKTVVVIAHRLSTVRNADKIVVLHQGQIAEQGSHEELLLLKGRYFELVKNQLELSN